MDSVRGVDRIAAELDYDSFELLPGTVNPQPGMRYIEAVSRFYNQNFVEDSEQSEETLDFVTNGVLIEDMSASFGMNGFVPYLLPVSAPCWIVDNHGDGGKKKRKNKKKRHKNRQRQRKHQLQLQMDQPQDVSPPTSPSSDGSSTDSPTNSPVKLPPQSPMEQTPDQISKNRRRGRGSRGRRLLFPPNYDIEYMGAQLNRMNLGPDLRYKSNPYLMQTQPIGPNYFPLNNRTDLFW